MWNDNKKPNTYVINITEEENRIREVILEEIVTEIFLKLEDNNTKFQEFWEP